MGEIYATLFSLKLRSSAFGRAFQQILQNLHLSETAQVIEPFVVEENLSVEYRHVLVLELLLLVDGSLGKGPRVQVTKVLLVDLCSLVHQLHVAILIHVAAAELLYNKVLHWVFMSGQWGNRAYFRIPRVIGGGMVEI